MTRGAYQHDVRDRDNDETTGKKGAQVGTHAPWCVDLHKKGKNYS
jgi:hypothetical protein